MVEKTESKYGWLEARCSGNHVVRRAICARAWVGRTYYYPPAEIEARASILLINTKLVSLLGNRNWIQKFNEIDLLIMLCELLLCDNSRHHVRLRLVVLYLMAGVLAGLDSFRHCASL
jgi:hypothetical protein